MVIRPMRYSAAVHMLLFREYYIDNIDKSKKIVLKYSQKGGKNETR